jgi:hypothetical protein
MNKMSIESPGIVLAWFLFLLGAGTASSETLAVDRGPWLQKARPSSMVIKWRTNFRSDSSVRYGTNSLLLEDRVDRPMNVLNHEIEVAGLQAATKYYYSVGTTTRTLAGGAGCYFITPPEVGTPQPTRVWVLGDSGTANGNAAAVATAYRTFTRDHYTDLWLMLGDNAYERGTDVEYQAAVFGMYRSLLRRTVLWPTIGNHDTGESEGPSLSIPYFSIFSLPMRGECGGIPSGTEKYYSFDYANIHFVCLDSMSSSRAVHGPMLTWLREDLSASTQQWLIAFWHHPPYSKGSHDSDRELNLIEMRRNALPILESHGVDLVLCGHSHCYERSFLLSGHYGYSSSFTKAMKVDSGSGRPEGSGAYVKEGTDPAGGMGTVYIVAGSSGMISSDGSLRHPAMFISLREMGSLVLDIAGDQLDAQFLDRTGNARDHFQVLKRKLIPSGEGG